MPDRLPRITGRELVAALERAGWRRVRQAGSHAQLHHPERAGTVTIPLHAGEILGPKLLSRILKQAGISPDELRQLL